jgi:O-antigen ligase
MTRIRLSGILTSALSFEAFLTLFLLAGMFKSDPRFSWLPYDASVLFFALSVAAAVVVLLKRGFRVTRTAMPIVAAGILFIGYVSATALWSPGRVYTMRKTAFVSVYCLWPLASCALIISPEERRFARLFNMNLGIGFFVALDALRLRLVTPWNTVLRMPSASYTSLGRLLGITALVLVFAKRPGLWRSLGCALLGFLLLTIGSRAPLVAFAGSVSLVAFIWRKPDRRRLSYGTLILVTASVLCAIAATLFVNVPATIARFALLTHGSDDPATAFRMWCLGISIDIWVKHPWFGAGLGSWPLLAGYADESRYPHNLFAELLSECGLAGLSLFLLLCCVSLLILATSRNHPNKRLVGALFLYALINAMVSGDMPNNRFIFVALGLVAAHKS